MSAVEFTDQELEELNDLTSAAEMSKNDRSSKAKLEKWVAQIVEKLPLSDLMERSSFRSWRLILKVFSVAVLGTSIALSTDSLFFRFIGIILITVSMSWADLVAEECRQSRFFPNLKLNKFFGTFLRWEVAAIIFATLYLFALSGVSSSLKSLDAAAIGQFWALPFLLMRLMKSSIGVFDERTLAISSEHKGPYLFPQFHEILSMVMETIDILPESKSKANIDDDKKSQLSEGTMQARITVQECCEKATDVPIYNLNQLSRSAADALTEAIQKVKFVTEYEAASTASEEEEDGLKIAVPDAKKLNRKNKPKHVQEWILRNIMAPLRALSREALLWERRDLPLYACMLTILTLFYFSLGHWSWLVLIAFSPLLGPKSKAAIALRDLQNDLGKMYTATANETDEIVRPPLWSVISVPMCFYMALIHALGFMGLFVAVSPTSWTYYTGIPAPSMTTIVAAIILYPVSCFGITGGVHRLWAHRSYQANFGYRLVLMIFNSMANQGSIFHWARDHRVHHLLSDTEADPYNAKRGFFFCHMGWMLVQKNQQVVEAGQKLDLKDLYADPIVMFQKKYDPFWNLLWCFGVPSILAWYTGDSWINGLLIPGALRYMLCLHVTWCVNSIVHTIGESKPYNPSHATTESAIVSFLALGEGWHNWHHAYGWDYATAELDWWQQYNPTKMAIDFSALFGLVWGRKRATAHWENRRQKWEEKYGKDPVLGLRGIPPFLHRDVDYELFDENPPTSDTKSRRGSQSSQDSEDLVKESQTKKRQRAAKCTKTAAARGLVTLSAAVLMASGAIVQGFANSYFGVNEYLCLSAFTIAGVCVAGYDFFTN